MDMQDTLKEDLDTLGVEWNDARDTANDRRPMF